MPMLGKPNLLWTGESNPRWTPKIHKSCEYCGDGMVTTAYRLSRGMGKYCSKECFDLSKVGVPSKKSGGITAICQVCQTSFKTIKSRLESGRGKYCSTACRDKYRSQFIEPWNKGKVMENMSGPNNPNWKGGTTPEAQSVRTSAEYLIWRNAVLQRDSYTCQSCGSKKKLHAHHILRFSDFPHKRFDISNGLTLCLSCHWKVHKKNKRRNT